MYVLCKILYLLTFILKIVAFILEFFRPKKESYVFTSFFHLIAV